MAHGRNQLDFTASTSDLSVPELITDRKLLDERAVMRYLEHIARSPSVPAGEIEQDFIEVAARFSVREGISSGAWLEYGVPGPVLSLCGLIGWPD